LTPATDPTLGPERREIMLNVSGLLYGTANRGSTRS